MDRVIDRRKKSPPGYRVWGIPMTHGQIWVKISKDGNILFAPEFQTGGDVAKAVQEGRLMAWRHYDEEQAEQARLGAVVGRLVNLIGQGKDLPMQDVFDTKLDVSHAYELDREAGLYRLKPVSEGIAGNVGV